MNIFELFDPAPAGYQDEKADNSVAKMSNSRGTRLTLAHLNQLRQSHDVRKLEHEKKLEAVAKQYAPAPEPGAGPAGVRARGAGGETADPRRSQPAAGADADADKHRAAAQCGGDAPDPRSHPRKAAGAAGRADGAPPRRPAGAGAGTGRHRAGTAVDGPDVRADAASRRLARGAVGDAGQP